MSFCVGRVFSESKLPKNKTHRHQFLMSAISRQWVRINYHHCPQTFVKSIASLRVSLSKRTSTIILSIQQSWSAFVSFSFESSKQQLTQLVKTNDRIDLQVDLVKDFSTNTTWL